MNIELNKMILNPLPLVSKFIKELNHDLVSTGERSLTVKQIFFLSLCITAMIFMGAFNLAAIERATLGSYTALALSGRSSRQGCGSNGVKVPCSQLIVQATSISDA